MGRTRSKLRGRLDTFWRCLRCWWFGKSLGVRGLDSNISMGCGFGITLKSCISYMSVANIITKI